MKKKLIIPFLVLSILNFAQKPIFTKAKVNAVDIYQNAGQLKNSVSVNLPKGNVELVIANISAEIEKESIQVGSDSKNVSILSSVFTKDYEYKTNLDKTNPKIKKYLDSLSLVKTKIQTLKIQLESTERSVALLDNNQKLLVGSNTSNVAQLSSLTDFYYKKRVELLLKVEKLKNQLSKWEKNKNIYHKKLKRTESRYAEEWGDGVLVLNIINKKAGKVKFNINYLTYQARWSPMYEIKANSKTKSLQTYLKASVYQNSGLDWKSVKVNLISSRYNRNNNAPKIYPWILSYNSLQKDKGYLQGQVAGVQINKSNNVRREASLEEEVAVGYSTSVNMLNTSYDIDIPYDILDDENHLIDIKNQNIKAKFEHYTAPSLSKQAYLVAKIKDFAQYDFISAPAKIIFDGMYIGETRLNTNQTDEALKITMGNDPRVNINKVYVKKNKSGQFLSNNKDLVKSYDLVISNKKKEKIEIEIQDRYPISENEKIEIDLVESSGAKVDKQKHILTWNKKLKPNEKITLRVTYKVKAPKDYKIYGL
ncbi:MAG: hypothetical protein CSA38_00445 [Flavobacteriales bacterium]|nr:MAG: hypothetical protein CSA38_00445 [Flavobacteriales bacterium]